MADRARDIANLLLREGSLRRTDPAHAEVAALLLGNADLWEDVHRRLDAVGYELVQRLGHVGVRLTREAARDADVRNRMGLHAGHVRLLVYLWVHLVYREWTDLSRGQASAAPGAEQEGLFGGEDPGDQDPFIAYSAVRAEFEAVTDVRSFKGVLGTLRRQRFVRVDEKRDRIWAGPSLFTLVDLERMEDFVVELARRMGTEDPAEAVRAIATGSRPAAGDGDDEEAP